MPFDADQLAEHALVDPQGGDHRLGDLWADSPHVLLFLRHFG
jgi:hypothetical protein